MDDAHSWQRVLSIVRRYDQPFVIVSAMARTTRQLLAAAELALNEPGKAQEIVRNIQSRHHQVVANFKNNFPNNETERIKECKLWIDKMISSLKNYLTEINDSQQLTSSAKDAVASIGEKLSSYLFARCGQMAGLPTRWVDAADIIRTDSNFEQAHPDTDFINKKTEELLGNIGPREIAVMGGYYGQDASGNTTTLGFEGSDYSASLIGAAASAKGIEIWTDVSGIYTCDPRLVSNARPIPQLSFQEATELAYFGAKVLHPSTTKPASANRIPIRVKNIFEPDEPGTRISHETHAEGRAKGMTFKENTVVITITSAATVMGYEFLSGIFDILRRHQLAVDVVTTTEASISIAIENEAKISDAIDQLQDYGSVELTAGQGIISLIGCAQQETRSLVNDVLRATDRSSVQLISFSQKKGNLNVVADKELVPDTVKTIHKSIFE